MRQGMIAALAVLMVLAAVGAGAQERRGELDADVPRGEDGKPTPDIVKRWVDERALNAPVEEFRELAEQLAAGNTDARVVRAFWRLYPRLYPFDTVPAPDRRLRALEVKRALEAAAAELDEPLDDGCWEPLGPRNIPGRMTALALHPTEPETVFTTGADGGVWKTTDLGDTWEALGDFEATLAMGALAVDQTDPDIIYAGTGEANYAGDNLAGLGVMKSTDGGATWTLSDRFASAFHELLIDPRDRTRLWAATRQGLFRSDDSGANWAQVGGGLPDEDCTDVLISAGDPDIMLAGIGSGFTGVGGRGLYRSDDGGAGWTLVADFPNDGDGGRIVLAQPVSTPSRIYGAVHNRDGGGLLGAYRSDDEGDTWTQTNAPDNPCNTYCWYCLTVGADPGDPDVAYLGGVSIYRTTDGGDSWERVNNVATNSYVHVDQHSFVTPEPGVFWSANDGGINLSTNHGTNWTYVGEKLETAQYYHLTTDPTSDDYALGGTQDQGTHRFSGSTSWDHVIGGDGAFTAIDWEDPSVWYGSTQRLRIYRSRNRGTGFSRVGSGIDGGEPRAFIAPFMLDRSDPNVMLTGTDRLYRSTNQGSDFVPISGDLTTDGGVITALDNCRDAPEAIWVGTSRGDFWYTADTGNEWNERGDGLPNRTITSIAAHPSLPETAWVTVGGTGVGHVWMTEDAGVNWTDVSAGLPDIHHNRVLVISDAPDILVVATDLGIYRSDDAGQSWRVYGDELPNVAVDWVSYSLVTGTLRAGTHGRGAWQLVPDGGCALPPRFDGLESVRVVESGDACLLELSWQPGTSTCLAAPGLSYNVYRSTDPIFTPGPATLLAAGLPGNDYLDTTAELGRLYTYLVKVEDGQTAAGGPANGGREDVNTARLHAQVGSPIVSESLQDDGGDSTAWLGGSLWSLSAAVNTTPGGRYAYTSTESEAGSHGSNVCAALVTPDFVVGPGARLTYNARYNIEEFWDGVAVEISTDGGNNWSDLPPDGGYPSDLRSTLGNGCGFPSDREVFNGPPGNGGLSDWAAYSSDLTAFEAQTARIRWVLTSDGGVELQGFYLDDIRVEPVSNPAAPPDRGSVLLGIKEGVQPRFLWTNLGGIDRYRVYHAVESDMFPRDALADLPSGDPGLVDSAPRPDPLDFYRVHAVQDCVNEGP